MPTPAYEPAHCIVCGHVEADVIARQDDLRDEVEMLWAYHQHRLRPETPSHRLIDRVAFSEHTPFQLVCCRECGLVYRNPVERSRELTEIYARETPPPDVLRSLHDTQLSTSRRQARSVRDALGHGGSGLEVGSYVGSFLAAARDEGLNVEGLDINAEVNAFARSMGFTVHDGALTTFETDRQFDAVAIWNTFDQLPDPRAAVVAASKLLRPRGVLVIRVPSGELYAAVRPWLWARNPAKRSVARALLAQNNLLTFPYRFGFTARSLTRLLEVGGFTVDRVRGDVLVPIADEWTRPWARLEETLIKRLMSIPAGRSVGWSPWFEVYATRNA